MKPNELDALIEDCLEGRLSEPDAARLSTHLEQSAEARARYWEAASIHGLLEHTMQNASLRAVTGQTLPTLPKINHWFAWRPLTAAAAGIVFGMFCTSVAFGFGARSVEKVLSLLQEGFESGPAPLVTGIPQEVNLWSGDYSEIVENYEGVKPKGGTKMARVLRSDFEGRVSSKPSLQGDLMRVVDVRPFLREASGGELVMTVSALFNAAPFPDAERYDGAVTLYALGQLGSTEESLLEDTLAHSQGWCRSLDRDPSTWQSASARLLLPAGTEFVMLKVSFRRWTTGSEGQSSLPDPMIFAGHFVDEVRASIRIRNAAPNQQNPALP